MFKIYNTNTLTNKQRFTQAIIAGFVAMLISIFAYRLVVSLLHVSSALLFLAMGYFIGWAVEHYGHGVQTKFSILAVVYTILAILISEMSLYFPYIPLLDSLRIVLASYLDISIHSLIGLFLRISAVLVAYQSSRIV